jgi:hypothetical protein
MTIKAQTMWRAAWLYAALWVTAMFIWVNNAFAQAPAAPAADPLPVTPGVATDLVQAAHTHKWGLLIAIGVGVLCKTLVWAGRKFDKTTAVGARIHQFLDLPGATFVLPLAGSVSGMIVTSLSAGVPIDVNGIADAVLIGLAAGGWGDPAKKVLTGEATDAGAAAAGAVASKEDAIKAIKGP